MPRRSRGRGSVVHRTSRRRFEAVLVVDGVKHTRSVTYTTAREQGRAKRHAEALLDELRAQYGGVSASRERTVADALEAWLASIEGSVRPVTFTSYAGVARNHITPHLGALELATLKVEHIDRWLAWMTKQGRSPQVQTRAHKVLHTAVKWCQVRGWIASNPLALTSPPKVGARERATLSGPQAQAFLDAVRGDRLEALWVIGASLGLRSGEVRGLRWSDVNGGSLHVERTLAYQRVRAGDGWTHVYALAETKTPRSRRELPLPAYVGQALEEHRERQRFEALHPAWTNEWDLIFTRRYTGEPLSSYGLAERLKVLLTRAGLPAVPFHALRHTAASLLLAQGVPPRTVQAILGHATSRLTMDLYAHSFDEDRQLARAALEAWRVQ